MELVAKLAWNGIKAITGTTTMANLRPVKRVTLFGVKCMLLNILPPYIKKLIHHLRVDIQFVTNESAFPCFIG